MFTKKSIFRMFIVLLVVLMMSGSTLARPLETPLGTGFTYQGKLTDGGVPANGAYDFEFKLYDALSSGSQVGGTVPKGDVTVTDGLFTVQLDFGNVFDGTAIFLDIGVRAGASTGTYTALTPRQALTATPYANYASKAPWSGLTGVPAGFADGVDNNTTYTAGDGLELDGTQFKGKGTSYENVIIVAKSGGDFTTITAALNSITTASSTNQFLIYVAPGVYTESVTMKPYVDIEGAGELTTKITSNGSTLWGASNAELRFLTVESTGGSTYAIAIINDNATPRLTHVTAYATGGTYTYGVLNRNNSSATMTNVTITAAGNVGGSASYFGVYNNDSYPVMTNCTVWSTGGAFAYGVYNEEGGATINNSVVKAGFGTENYGIHNISATSYWSVVVNSSQIWGSTNSIWNDAAFYSYVSTSQLGGGPVYNIGTVKCVGVYDESYNSAGYTVCP